MHPSATDASLGCSLGAVASAVLRDGYHGCTVTHFEGRTWAGVPLSGIFGDGVYEDAEVDPKSSEARVLDSCGDSWLAEDLYANPGPIQTTEIPSTPSPCQYLVDVRNAAHGLSEIQSSDPSSWSTTQARVLSGLVSAAADLLRGD